MWGWIKRWFDPITVSKIFILGPHEVKPVIESFIHPANFPTTYGGQLEWKWNDPPTLDPAIDEAVTWENGFTHFPIGPMYWRPIEGDPDRLECFAVGTEKGQDRRIRVCTIKRTYRPPGPKTEEEPVVAKVETVPRAEAEKEMAAGTPGPAVEATPAAPASGADDIVPPPTPGEAGPPPPDAVRSDDLAKADEPTKEMEALTLSGEKPQVAADPADAAVEKKAEALAQENGAPVQAPTGV